MLNYNYLSTPEDLAAFGSRDLEKYDYLVLIRIPGDRLDRDELNLMRGMLERFMKDGSLVAIAQELEAVADDAYVRSIYKTAFPDPPEFEAYVAASTIHPDVNERVFLAPVYHELEPSNGARRPYFEMLGSSLQALQFSLCHASLGDIPLPALPSAMQNLVIPDGQAVKEFREKQGMSQEDFALQCKLSNHKPISKVENGYPVKRDTLELVAVYMEKPVERILFVDVVPHRKNLARLRTKTGLTRNELAKRMELPAGSFFDLLEITDRVPGRVMRTVHYLYGKVLRDENIPFAETMDVEATRKLASRQG